MYTCGGTGNLDRRSQAADDGTGYVVAEIGWDWDGVSAPPNCNGTVTSIHTQNTSQMTCWAMLPNKKRGSLWVQIDPGTETVTTSPGQLSQLGLSTYQDTLGVRLQFSAPA